MTPSAPCSRHSPHVWMVACPDCTAWHLPAARARRDAAAAPRPETTDHRPALRLTA